jgi:hypothetical protein
MKMKMKMKMKMSIDTATCNDIVGTGNQAGSWSRTNV